MLLTYYDIYVMSWPPRTVVYSDLLLILVTYHWGDPIVISRMIIMLKVNSLLHQFDHTSVTRLDVTIILF